MCLASGYLPTVFRRGFLADRKALVTGAAGEIGRACVEHLAVAGAEVHVVARATPAAKEVAEAIGGRAVVADLSEPSTSRPSTPWRA